MGLYRPKDVTPYMHVLVHHLPEFMEQHQKFGLNAFSCAPVEKKNYDQVSAFFRKTMKDGGKGAERKSAIFEILYYENRSMYFTQQQCWYGEALGHDWNTWDISKLLVEVGTGFSIANRFYRYLETRTRI